jgi:hypothetical protein
MHIMKIDLEGVGIAWQCDWNLVLSFPLKFGVYK